jgi:hypothetical protein
MIIETATININPNAEGIDIFSAPPVPYFVGSVSPKSGDTDAANDIAHLSSVIAALVAGLVPQGAACIVNGTVTTTNGAEVSYTWENGAIKGEAAYNKEAGKLHSDVDSLIRNLAERDAQKTFENNAQISA